MPPKAKGKPSKKDANKVEEGAEVATEKDAPTEKEIQLKTQLAAITAELEKMKVTVAELRHENEFLQQESQQIRLETHEYMAYVSKKTERRQNAVITLSDHNAAQIREIHQKKEEMMKKFSEEKDRLQNTILSREAELASIKDELDNLNDYKVLQKEQRGEIAELEKQVAEMRVKHNEAVQKLKARFLEEKKTFQAEADDNLKELNKEAQKEARNCLQQHSQRIKLENRALRRELLQLIQQTRALHSHKLKLEDQKKIIIREKEYADHVRMLREERRKNLYESYGIEEQEEVEG